MIRLQNLFFQRVDNKGYVMMIWKDEKNLKNLETVAWHDEVKHVLQDLHTWHISSQRSSTVMLLVLLSFSVTFGHQFSSLLDELFIFQMSLMFFTWNMELRVGHRKDNFFKTLLCNRLLLYLIPIFVFLFYIALKDNIAN